MNSQPDSYMVCDCEGTTFEGFTISISKEMFIFMAGFVQFAGPFGSHRLDLVLMAT